MILPTPKPSKIVLKDIDSKFSRDWPIIKNYPGYEVCFLLLHPFLRIKLGHRDDILFMTGKWPSKNEIIKHCEPLTWTEFLRLSKITDYKRLGHALNFMQSAVKYGDKVEFDKLLKFAGLNKEIIPPQPDDFPEILENSILTFFRNKNYTNVYVYTDIFPEKTLSNIDTLFDSDHLPNHVRIQTPDNKYLIVTDFDCCFSYFLGSQLEIDEMVAAFDFEGFYCDNETTEFWGFDEVAAKNKVDRQYRGPA